jgi:hypothetical protein
MFASCGKAMNKVLKVLIVWCVALSPALAGATEVGSTGEDPGSWGSYQGLRVNGASESRGVRSYLPAPPKSNFTVDSASANNEGGVVTFFYSPSFKDSSKDGVGRAAAQPTAGGRSGFSFFGQLGDPRYGLKGTDTHLPADRPGGFVFDAQRDFRRYPGFSFGVGYDF